MTAVAKTARMAMTTRSSIKVKDSLKRKFISSIIAGKRHAFLFVGGELKEQTDQF